MVLCTNTALLRAPNQFKYIIAWYVTIPGATYVYDCVLGFQMHLTFCVQKTWLKPMLGLQCHSSHAFLIFQKTGWSFWFQVCRFCFKAIILLAHHTVTGKGQQLFPTQDEVRGRNSLKNQTCCHGNQNKYFRGQTGCIYKSEMRKILPVYNNILSGKCLHYRKSDIYWLNKCWGVKQYVIIFYNTTWLCRKQWYMCLREKQ